MTKKQEYITKIINLLTRLPKLVESSNKLNLTDANNFSEDFYEQLLNLVYGYNLKNANQFAPNAAAIDLQDLKNKIAIQVTSTSSLTKTKRTVDKFIEYKLFNSYDRLIILNIVKKSKHKEEKIGDENFKINTQKDIWDIDNVLKKIKYINNIEQIKSIQDFLVKELHDQPTSTLPNEVNTILAMIELLSNEQHPDAGYGFIEDPDPNNKIHKRFSDHAEHLTNRYYDLYIEYGKVLTTINEESDIGSQALRRAGTYLKGYSDDVLTKCGGNPREALQRLVDAFKSHLSNLGFSFDSCAAEFYIVDQLIKCNVFPNRMVKNG
ncbi:MAG: SMEK domain-containing protein [Candidatus Electrothrix communis]|nr:MAG: SMEK domain-containing protein [Candidatus Electrothrix communis]